MWAKTEDRTVMSYMVPQPPDVSDTDTWSQGRAAVMRDAMCFSADEAAGEDRKSVV